jgi:hypothetical protein
MTTVGLGGPTTVPTISTLPTYPVARMDAQLRHALGRSAVTGALTHLDPTGKPFEFFADRTTGRGPVVHARYDGHHTMLSAAAPHWQPS